MPLGPHHTLSSRPDAPWLPAGGLAEVVCAGDEAISPEPTCLVRVLVTRDNRSVLVVPRADGKGHVGGSVDGYEWPTPDAYFAVWRCDGCPEQVTDGRWLAPEEIEQELGERHWWPLARHVGVR